MPLVATFAPGLSEAWERKRHYELFPEDIDQQWMDLMVKRLFRELDRQLNQIEKSDPPTEPAARAQNARALASMERTLGRMTRMEKERQAHRETKIAETADDKRAKLQRRLSRLSAPETMSGLPDDSD